MVGAGSTLGLFLVRKASTFASSSADVIVGGVAVRFGLGGEGGAGLAAFASRAARILAFAIRAARISARVFAAGLASAFGAFAAGLASAFGVFAAGLSSATTDGPNAATRTSRPRGAAVSPLRIV